MRSEQVADDLGEAREDLAALEKDCEQVGIGMAEGKGEEEGYGVLSSEHVPMTWVIMAALPT